MFDLNQEVAQWKQSFGLSESVTHPDLDELESHLHDQIDTLTLSGLSPQEAFLVARHRIGDLKQVAGEYAKVNGFSIFRRRLQWMLVGILAYMLIFNVSYLGSVAGVFGAYSAGIRGYLPGYIGQGAQFLMIFVGLVLVAAILRIPGLGHLVESLGGAIVLGLVVMIGSLVLVAARILVPLLTVRLVNIEDYGRLTIVQNVAGLAYSFIIPILIVALLILLRRQPATPGSVNA
jgi:hypothetical protein